MYIYIYIARDKQKVYIAGNACIYIDSDINYIKKEKQKEVNDERPRPQRNIPTLLKNSRICPSNGKTSKVFTKSQQNLEKVLKP